MFKTVDVIDSRCFRQTQSASFKKPSSVLKVKKLQSGDLLHNDWHSSALLVFVEVSFTSLVPSSM